jgi:hypothetical protein
MQASRISIGQAEYKGGHWQRKNKVLSKKAELRARNVKINTGSLEGGVLFSTNKHFQLYKLYKLTL